jgi:hypothetical protein
MLFFSEAEMSGDFSTQPDTGSLVESPWLKKFLIDLEGVTECREVSLLTEIDPQPSDNFGKRYGSLLIQKLSVEFRGRSISGGQRGSPGHRGCQERQRFRLRRAG